MLLSEVGSIKSDDATLALAGILMQSFGSNGLVWGAAGGDRKKGLGIMNLYDGAKKKEVSSMKLFDVSSAPVEESTNSLLYEEADDIIFATSYAGLGLPEPSSSGTSIETILSNAQELSCETSESTGDKWLEASIAELRKKTLEVSGGMTKDELINLLQYTVDKCVCYAEVLADRRKGTEDVISLGRFKKYFDSVAELRNLVAKNYADNADVLEEFKSWNFLFKDSTATMKWMWKLSLGKVSSKLREHLNKIPAPEVYRVLGITKV